MIAKRFTLAYADYDWWAICDKENLIEGGISGENVCELLNELADENEELKNSNHRLSQNLINSLDKLRQLEKENEQLKQFIDGLTTKGSGRIDLANGYSYSVNAVLTNWKSDVE